MANEPRTITVDPESELARALGESDDTTVRLDVRGVRILTALDQVAGKLHSTPAKVSLAWLLARPSITAPIASATSVEQLHGLIDATNLTLDAESIELLNQASAWSATAAH